jgi:lipid-A-disaccharide synthase-like uncharacterized protein
MVFQSCNLLAYGNWVDIGFMPSMLFSAKFVVRQGAIRAGSLQATPPL